MTYTFESMEEFLRDLLKSVSPRGKDIISRRYGIFLSRLMETPHSEAKADLSAFALRATADKSAKALQATAGLPAKALQATAGGKIRLETLESIGKTYRITRERVRQLEADSLKRVAAAKRTDARFAHWIKFLDHLFRERGYVIAERTLFEESLLSGNPPSQTMLAVKHVVPTLPIGRQAVRQACLPARQGYGITFLLRLANKYIRRKEDDFFHAHWTSDLTRAEHVARALREVARHLETHSPVSEEELAHMLKKQLEEPVSFASVRAYLALSKKIAKNKWNEYGHVSSSLIRPRGMRDGAYIVLARIKTPLHFSQIARKIQDVFADRHIHVQTVHNELIKDKRFVLVGRGLYALAEWGYEPGFVKDIICNVLKERGSCRKEMIVAEVMKRRQVKENTILMNLNNKKLFQALPNGKYTLVA